MREYSSGGVIIRKNSLLLIKTKNLAGKIVWTFPKGHIEKGELKEEAACREALEETGYQCKIIKPLGKTKHFFYIGKRFIEKTVFWFLMEPLRKAQKHDSETICTKWIEIKNYKEYLRYKTDLTTLKEIIKSREKEVTNEI